MNVVKAYSEMDDLNKSVCDKLLVIETRWTERHAKDEQHFREHTYPVDDEEVGHKYVRAIEWSERLVVAESFLNYMEQQGLTNQYIYVKYEERPPITKLRNAITIYTDMLVRNLERGGSTSNFHNAVSHAKREAIGELWRELDRTMSELKKEFGIDG